MWDMRRKRALLVTTMLLGVSVVAGCGGGSDEDGVAGTAAKGGAAAKADNLKIIYIGNAPATDVFQTSLISGVDRAKSTFKIDVTYRSPGKSTVDATAMVPLLKNAIAERPDGIVMWDGNAAALNPLIKQAVQSGIAVVLSNDGSAADAETTGALTYVGNDEVAYGRLAAKRLGELGAKHLLYLSVAPGTGKIFDDREKGVKEGFPGKVTVLSPPATVLGNATQTRNLMLAAIQKDPTIDGVLSIGSCCSAAEIAARKKLGAAAEKIKWATLDLGEPAMNGVKNGDLEFALDQQNFLQGFWPVMVLEQYLRDGITPASSFMQTGPAFVDAKNIDKITSRNSRDVR